MPMTDFPEAVRIARSLAGGYNAPQDRRARASGEVAMKSPRISISGLMALVLIVALDFGAYRAFQDGSALGRDLSDLIVFGALPMANLLAVGLMPFFTSRPDRGGRSPALVGFEVFGVAGLLVFLGCSLLATHTIHEGVGDVLQPLGLRPGGPIFLAWAVALLLLPQLTLALLGGLLGERYFIRVKVLGERRRRPEPGPTPTPDQRVIVGAVGAEDILDGRSPSSICRHRCDHDEVTSPVPSIQ
jgi:hypothetical protein